MLLDMDIVVQGDVEYSQASLWKTPGFVHQMHCLRDDYRGNMTKRMVYAFSTLDVHEYDLEITYSLAPDRVEHIIRMVRVPDYQVKCLSPVMSAYNQNMYRVILKQVDKGYEVHVGEDFIRMFKDYRNLPKEVKEKLGIVYAKFPNAQDDDTLKRMSVSAYLNSDEDMQAIGWRISRSWTCLVLTEKTLNSLRGETINDSGRKGESQGQETS